MLLTYSYLCHKMPVNSTPLQAIRRDHFLTEELGVED